MNLPARILFGMFNFHVALSGGGPEEKLFALLALLADAGVVLHQVLPDLGRGCHYLVSADGAGHLAKPELLDLTLKRKPFISQKTLEVRLYYRLYFCAHHFFSKMENGPLFSSSLPCFDKCHETSRIFLRTKQTFASARKSAEGNGEYL